MPKNINQIQFGKIVVTGENSLSELENILDRIMKKHGYPEERKSASEEDIKKLDKMLQDPETAQKSFISPIR